MYCVTMWFFLNVSVWLCSVKMMIMVWCLTFSGNYYTQIRSRIYLCDDLGAFFVLNSDLVVQLLYYKPVNTEVVSSNPAKRRYTQHQPSLTRIVSFHTEGRWSLLASSPNKNWLPSNSRKVLKVVLNINQSINCTQQTSWTI